MKQNIVASILHGVANNAVVWQLHICETYREEDSSYSEAERVDESLDEGASGPLPFAHHRDRPETSRAADGSVHRCSHT